MLHRSLIFRGQLWASLPSATLDFKQPLHQFGEVFHVSSKPGEHAFNSSLLAIMKTGLRIN
jgi:hypothetical protein